MRFLAIFIATIPLICLVGCDNTTRAERAAAEGILLLGNGSEPKALDPHLVQSVGDSNLMIALFEGLVTFDMHDDAVAAPGVAETWDHSDDYRVWTFHLRNNAKWSNGDPVTAHDFAYGHERILTPELGSPYASMLYYLVNAKEFNESKIDDFSQVGVKVIDDHTIHYTLDLPTEFFPSVLKHQTWLPVHQPTIEKFGSMTDRYTMWQRPGNHVGNGAFQLKSWRVNHSIVVEPNPHYWDRDVVKLKEIHFLPIDNWFTEERMFRDGQMHVSYILPSSIRGWYEANRPELMRREPYAGIYFYRLNTGENGPEALKDKRVRKALALTVDRKELADYVTLGGEKPSYGFAFPMGGYDPPHVVNYDPERAQQLLADAGYPGGKGFPVLNLMINTSEQHRVLAEAIQAMWKKNLGIEVEIDNQEWKVFQQTVFEEKYEMARSGWIADFTDATTFLDMMRTGDSNNNTGWGNADYDRLLREAAVEPSPEERRAKLFEAEEILLDELPVIPIYWYSRVYLIDPAVQNWNPLALDKRDYKHVWLKPKE